MTNREVVKNHLHLADETCETYKGVQAATSFKERIWMSFALLIARAVCSALLAIADEVRDVAGEIRAGRLQ